MISVITHSDLISAQRGQAVRPAPVVIARARTSDGLGRAAPDGASRWLGREVSRGRFSLPAAPAGVRGVRRGA
jgi:hypothetical protein